MALGTRVPVAVSIPAHNIRIAGGGLQVAFAGFFAAHQVQLAMSQRLDIWDWKIA